MRSLSDQEVYLKLGDALFRHHRVVSMGQLAKLAGVSDDMARRCLERLKKQLNDKELIVSVEGRLSFTAAGKKLLHLFNELFALAKHGEAPPELLTVEADGLVVESLFPAALSSFLELWGSFTQLRIGPLDGSSVRQRIQEGITALGIGYGDSSETILPAEILGPKIPWVLLVPRDKHRLASLDVNVTAEQLRGDDRVFASRQALAFSDLTTFLAAVPQPNRIECNSVIALVAAGLGLGIVPDFGNQEIEGVSKLVIQNVEPVQPRLFLPRQGAGALSKPLQCFVQALRKAVEARYATVTPPLLFAAETVNGSPAEQLLTSLEETNS